MKKIRWGVLSTAKIGVAKVIPAMQQGQYSEIVAISSRDAHKARAAAERLGIPRAYDSYEALLADPEIDAVYNPTPNHLHAPLTLAALAAGKHVLCEKPIALNAAEARQLQAAVQAQPHLQVMEAFMYRYHPQWQQVKQWVRQGVVGELRTLHTHFSYHNVDPANVRHHPEMGGGGLLDIGCYAVNLSRWLFESEPQRVTAQLEQDPRFGVDVLASGILDFGGRSATFTVSTQLSYHQRVMIYGELGHIEMPWPFNPAPDAPARLLLTRNDHTETVVTSPANQYTLQGDAFSRALLDHAPTPIPLTDAVANMATLDALFRSADTGRWQPVR